MMTVPPSPNPREKGDGDLTSEATILEFGIPMHHDSRSFSRRDLPIVIFVSLSRPTLAVCELAVGNSRESFLSRHSALT